MINLLNCVNPVPVRLDDGTYLGVRCGKCPLCDLKKKSEWTVRLEIEVSYHDYNSFVTLTYDDEHRPSNGICYRDVQLFFKRFRKRGYRFRYFCANEYGSSANTFREHAHLILFGVKALPSVRNDVQECWPNGFVEMRGMVANDACCNYTCGYVDKKSESFLSDAEAKYRDYQYNVLGKRKPFVVMSRNPGIAYQFYSDHKDQISNDFCFHWHGVKHALSPYFVKLCKADFGDDWCDRYLEFGLANAKRNYDKVLEALTPHEIRERVAFLESQDLDIDYDDFDSLVHRRHVESVYQKVVDLRKRQSMFVKSHRRRVI